MPSSDLNYHDPGWEQREIDIDLIEEALDPYLRNPGNDKWSPHDLVTELSASELLDVLHRADLLRVPTRPKLTDGGAA